MEEKKNQKKKVLILILVLGLVLLTVGGTYAFFTYSKQGVEEHVLTTGSLYFVYDELPNEEDSNKISIGNAFPVSDETGMQQDKPGMFEFEVRAKTQGADINYEIYLTKDESSTLLEKVVDTYLTTTGKKGENAQESLVRPSWENKWTKENGVTQYQFLWNSHVPEAEEQKGKSLYQETISDTKGQEYSKIFRYRMWLDESAEGVNAKGEWIYGGKSFTVRVNVYASNEELPAPTPVGVIQKWTYNMGTTNELEMFPDIDFHTRDKIFSISNIRFENKIEIPESVSQDNQWDISEKKDGSVMAYLVPNETEGETCQDPMSIDGGTNPCNDIIIVSNGETYGNPDSSWAFAMFLNLKSIDFTHYNSSLIENTGGMFYTCSSLNSLDLNNWDISSLKAINITRKIIIPGYEELVMLNGMFNGCDNLVELHLNNWDISNITDMSRMFSGCSKISELNLNGWNTSNVTNMNGMFDGCHQLNTITGIEGWNTSNVTDMSNMFSGCSQLTDFSFLENWTTMNVTNMLGMFNDCSQLTELKLSNWDTSNVISMYGMFFDCNQLTELDLSGWDISSVTDMSEMFYNCSQLNAIYVKDNNIKQWFIDNADTMWLNNPNDVVQVKSA